MFHAILVIHAVLALQAAAPHGYARPAPATVCFASASSCGKPVQHVVCFAQEGSCSKRAHVVAAPNVPINYPITLSSEP
jgi:hypothetical protein